MSFFRNLLISFFAITPFAFAGFQPIEFKVAESHGHLCYADMEYGKGGISLSVSLTEEKLDMDVWLGCWTKGMGYGKTLKETYTVKNGIILTSKGEVIGEVNDKGITLRLYYPQFPNGKYELMVFQKDTTSGQFFFGYNYSDGNPASYHHFETSFKIK